MVLRKFVSQFMLHFKQKAMRYCTRTRIEHHILRSRLASIFAMQYYYIKNSIKSHTRLIVNLIIIFVTE